MYALSMVILYSNYKYSNPNVSPGLIFRGLMFVRIFELACREIIFGRAYIHDCMV